MKNLTKYALADQLIRGSQHVNRMAAAVDIIETVADLIVLHLQQGGEKVTIRGFGVFKIRQRKKFQGSNPKTGAPVAVEPKRSISFKPSAEAVRRVNS